MTAGVKNFGASAGCFAFVRRPRRAIILSRPHALELIGRRGADLRLCSWRGAVLGWRDVYPWMRPESATNRRNACSRTATSS